MGKEWGKSDYINTRLPAMYYSFRQLMHGLDHQRFGLEGNQIQSNLCTIYYLFRLLQ